MANHLADGGDSVGFLHSVARDMEDSPLENYIG